MRLYGSVCKSNPQKFFHRPADVAAVFPVKINVSAAGGTVKLVKNQSRMLRHSCNQRIAQKCDAKAGSSNVVGGELLIKLKYNIRSNLMFLQDCYRTFAGIIFRLQHNKRGVRKQGKRNLISERLFVGCEGIRYGQKKLFPAKQHPAERFLIQKTVVHQQVNTAVLKQNGKLRDFTAAAEAVKKRTASPSQSTQMQDAVPIRLGQEFKAYFIAIMRDIHRMDKAMEEMCTLNMGGTAVGTGLNADETYLRRIVPNLAEVSDMELVQAFDLIDATQNLDSFVAVSGAVKACAVTLSKIANDLRLMSSGPRAGFNEINLPAKQNGSSIMPGKVNPVIPEVVNQVAFNIIGNDVTITMAAEAGQLELNAFEPIIFYCMFQSIDTLAYAVKTFVDNCISGITANETRCRYLVENSVTDYGNLSARWLSEGGRDCQGGFEDRGVGAQPDSERASA